MKIIDYVVCDDIRKEINNKFTICGAYNDRIEFQVKSGMDFKFPFKVYTLGFYIRINLEGKDDFTELQTDFYLNEQHLNSSNGRVFNITNPDRPMILPIIVRGFEIPGEGELRFSVSLFKEGNLIEKSELSKPFSITLKQI